MKIQIQEEIKKLADYYDQSITEFLTTNFVKTIDSKEYDKLDQLITFDEGKNYYTRSDLECLYIDSMYEIRTENYLSS